MFSNVCHFLLVWWPLQIRQEGAFSSLLVKMRNGTGPRTGPCSIPWVNGLQGGVWPIKCDPLSQIIPPGFLILFYPPCSSQCPNLNNAFFLILSTSPGGTNVDEGHKGICVLLRDKGSCILINILTITLSSLINAMCNCENAARQTKFQVHMVQEHKKTTVISRDFEKKMP